MRVLLDVNILLDVLAHREPYYTESARVWAIIESGQLQGLVAAHSITTLFYLLSRHTKPAKAQTVLLDLLKVFSVALVDQNVILEALAMGWQDFKDAVQMSAASKANATYIITRNTKDFEHGPVPAIQPVEFLTLINIDTD
jgi:predicted nucleic acid-binding protein